MIKWLFLALGAATMWGVVNVVDKIIVEKHIRNPLVYLIFGGIYGLIPAIFIGMRGLQPISSTIVLLSMFTGFLLIVHTYLYFKALCFGDTSVVASLLQMSAVFSLVWGFLIFDEIFTISTYIGIFLVLCGATLIAVPLQVEQAGDKKWRRIVSHVMILMIPSTFFASCGYAIQNYVVEYADASTVFFWGRIGTLLSVVVLLFDKRIRSCTLDTLRKVDMKINFVIVVNEVTSILAVFMVIAAYALGSLSLVSTAISVQPLFAMVFVMVINSIKRDAIPDHTTREIFFLRLGCILLIVGGIYLIT